MNILPLFSEIENNNFFSIYTRSDLRKKTKKKKQLKFDLIDVSIYAWQTYNLYGTCAKLLTEFTNMGNVVNLRYHPLTNQAR